jgi:hypothetical protein
MPGGGVSYAHATTCSQYKAKERGLPWFAPDSPEFAVIVQLPLALRGKGDGASSVEPTRLGCLNRKRTSESKTQARSCTCPSTGSGARMLRYLLSSLVVVVAVVAMMMTPIVATRVIPVGAVTTVVVRSPPAPAIASADPTYLLHIRSTVCREWCDRHCSRCGRC